MATSTPNHGLYKYGGDDQPDLTALGPSMDKIDLELKKNADNIGLIQAENVGGQISAYRIGKFVMLLGNCDGEVTLQPGAYTSLVTLPEQYRPISQIPFTFHMTGSAAQGQSAYVEPFGLVRLFVEKSPISYWGFSVMYMTA